MDIKNATLPLASLGAQGALTQQRANSAVSKGESGSFSGAMKSALGTISESLKEVKGALDATTLPEQQRADLAEVFKGFGMFMDQLAQTYVPKTGGSAATAPALTPTLPSAPVLGQNYSTTAPSLVPKLDSLDDTPQTNATDQWVIAALNRAIGQNVANGYDPEKSHAVNTLRGYFSGDAAAKSHAIHSIDSSLLKAGNAYETNDFGVHTIAGAAPEGLNTTMPTFKTDYDKDWNRPSLYDQINSSMGWSAAANHYSDPASRDAALNRKLSDSEILSFQNGSLPPDLQALVSKYRGG